MTDSPAPPLPARQATRPSAQGGRPDVRIVNGVAVHDVGSRALPKINTAKHGLHGKKS